MRLRLQNGSSIASCQCLMRRQLLSSASLQILALTGRAVNPPGANGANLRNLGAPAIRKARIPARRRDRPSRQPTESLPETGRSTSGPASRACPEAGKDCRQRFAEAIPPRSECPERDPASCEGDAWVERMLAAGRVWRRGARARPRCPEVSQAPGPEKKRDQPQLLGGNLPDWRKPSVGGWCPRCRPLNGPMAEPATVIA